MSAGRIILLVFGIIFVLISFGLIAGGGVILAFESAFRDNEGFYTVHDVSVQADSLALVTEPADIDFGPGWSWWQRNPITIRIEATNSQESKPIFIGIARSADINQYLNNVAYHEISGFSLSPNRFEMLRHSGTRVPAPPAEQNFWVVSTSGAGTQRLQWDVEPGNYSLVLMNSDATTPIFAEASVGARIPAVLRSIGWGLLIGGIVILVIGGVMIFFAARGW